MKRILFKGKPYYLPEDVHVDAAIPVMNRAYAHAQIAEQMWRENGTEIAQIVRAGQYRLQWMDNETKIYLYASPEVIIEPALIEQKIENLSFEPRLAYLDSSAAWDLSSYEYSIHSENSYLPVAGQVREMQFDEENYFETLDEGSDKYTEITFKRLEKVGEFTIGGGLSGHSYSRQVIDWTRYILNTELYYRNCFDSYGHSVLRDPLITLGPGMDIRYGDYSCYNDDEWDFYNADEIIETRVKNETYTIDDDGEILHATTATQTYHQVFETIGTYVVPDNYDTQWGIYPEFAGNCSRPDGTYDIIQTTEGTGTTSAGTYLFCDFGTSWTDPAGTRHRAYMWTYEPANSEYIFNLTVDDNTWELRHALYAEGSVWMPLIHSYQTDIFDFNGSPVIIYSFVELYGLNIPDYQLLQHGMVWQGQIYRGEPFLHHDLYSRDLYTEDGYHVSQYMTAIGMERKETKIVKGQKFINRLRYLDDQPAED